jgi:hypothetical protein
MEFSMVSPLATCLRIACAIGFGLATIELAAAQESQSRAPDNAVEASFLRENNAAMTKMMNDMAVAPTGDVDRDFALSMIPHHQGAIDMAQAELRYGKNEQLRRIAQEIIVGQLQEIAAMHLALGDPLPPSAAAPTQPDAMSGETGSHSAHDHPAMSPGPMQMPADGK